MLRHCIEVNWLTILSNSSTDTHEVSVVVGVVENPNETYYKFTAVVPCVIGRVAAQNGTKLRAIATQLLNFNVRSATKT